MLVTNLHITCVTTLRQGAELTMDIRKELERVVNLV
jgi:hypothetical protein